MRIGFISSELVLLEVEWTVWKLANTKFAYWDVNTHFVLTLVSNEDSEFVAKWRTCSASSSDF